MHVQGRFPLPELRKKRDGCLEMLRTGTRVILKVLEVADPGLFGDGLGFLLILSKFGIYTVIVSVVPAS